jgi:REP element-mobilizing transposase RayT
MAKHTQTPRRTKPVAQPSPAAGSRTVPVREIGTGSETLPQPAGADACATPPHLVSGFHSRGVLPHLKREGGTYFVTFREAGTLPREVLVLLKQERELILKHALAAKRPLTWTEQKELFQWYSERVDRYLDAGRGSCHLARPEIAAVVGSAIRFFDGRRYELRAWVIMPNHVHAVVRPAPPCSLSKILHTWKSFSSHEINKLFPVKRVPFWQSESYDHLIRDDEDLQRCVHYTLMNPVNAGLCRDPQDWRWSSAHVAQPSPAAGLRTVPVRDENRSQ